MTYPTSADYNFSGMRPQADGYNPQFMPSQSYGVQPQAAPTFVDNPYKPMSSDPSLTAQVPRYVGGEGKKGVSDAEKKAAQQQMAEGMKAGSSIGEALSGYEMQFDPTMAKIDTLRTPVSKYGT